MKKTINGYMYTIAPGADLRGANLRDAYLRDAHLNGANLSGTDLSGADLSGTDLKGAYLGCANLKGANLSSASLIGADLSCANLKGAYLSGAKGLGTKEGEISFAKFLLEKIRQNPDLLNMRHWHCGTAHCIAGHAFPDLERPGQPASLLYPTLAQYFLVSNEEAIAALERVSRGEESVLD